MWTAETLAARIVMFDRSAISPAIKDKVTELVIDVVGAAASGANTDSAKAVRNVCRELSRAGPCLTWFTNMRFPPAFAAFANSAAAAALDVDDGHRRAIGHPGAAVIPAMVAEAETSRASAEDLLTAIVVGYETGIRVAAAQHDREHTRLFATGRWAPVAVAAGVGLLRGLDRGQMAQAFAIAATHRPAQLPSGTSQQLGHAKEGIPWATLTGFTAVSLAQNGFTASLDIFDIAELFDEAPVHEGFGTNMELEHVYTKPYSCCRWIHAPIDALLSIMEQHDVSYDQIAAVRVHTIGPAVRLNNKPDPVAHFEAQFSVPFCLAVAAICGPDALLTPDHRLLHRPDLVAFAQKVTLAIDPELDRLFPERTGACLTVTTSEGIYEERVDFPKGEQTNPMTHSEIMRKFERLSTYGLGALAGARLTGNLAGLTPSELDEVVDRIAEVELPS